MLPKTVFHWLKLQAGDNDEVFSFIAVGAHLKKQFGVLVEWDKAKLVND